MTTTSKKRPWPIEVLARLLAAIAMETYLLRGIPASGYSFSSTKAVLRAASDLCLERGLPLSLADVADLALRYERGRARGRGIAAQDVTPIVYGGLVKTQTHATGAIYHEEIPCDPVWISDHVIWANHPSGERHDVPDLLVSLLDDPRAMEYVARISELAIGAEEGFRAHDITRVAKAVCAYREIFFEEWGRGRLVNPWVASLVKDLESQFGNQCLAWKPPGAGAASSIIVITTAAIPMLNYLQAAGWHASPAIPAPGLQCVRKQAAGREEILISAPQRIDFCGAADLGQDEKIQVDGICLGLAIEPQSEVRIQLTQVA